MASKRRQPRKHGHRYEIRECRSTPRGPRQYVLASFTGVLTPVLLVAGEQAAQRPFDRAKLVERARAQGIGVAPRRRNRPARALLAALSRGAMLDPQLVTLLRRALEPLPASPLPEHLEEATDWVGQPERERGRALRGLLRTADRILQSRGPLRGRDQRRYPRFHSGSAGEPEAEAAAG
jgi:hypothetical protein